jgi:MFS family permease
MSTTHPEILDNLRHNYIFNVLDGAFFGLAIGFASFMTIIPLFVSTLTGSAILIGLIPAIHNMGWQLPQLLIANRVSQQSRYKPMVVMITLHERLPFLGLALTAWLVPVIGINNALIITFILLIWQGIGAGFTANPWQSLIAKIMPADRRGTFFGVQSSAANVLASLSAIAAGYLLGALNSPTDFTICFLLATLSMGISWVALTQTREPSTPPTQPPSGRKEFWQKLGQILKSDANFRWFLAVRMLSQVALMGFAFYTVYAVQVLGMNVFTVGILTSVLLATQIVANPLMGWFGDRWSHRLLMAIGLLSAAFSGLLAWLAPSPNWFYLVFILAGIAYVAVWTIGLAMVLNFGEESERPAYIGLANTLIAPASILAPLVGGWLAEQYGYPAAFITSAIAGFVTAIILYAFVRDPQKNPLPEKVQL